MTERTFDLELNELREKVAYLAGITSRVLDTSSQLLTEQDLIFETGNSQAGKGVRPAGKWNPGKGLHSDGPLSAGSS